MPMNTTCPMRTPACARITSAWPEVPREPAEAGGAERAAHGAARLRAEARAQAPVVEPHQDAFDALAVGELDEVFGRRAVGRILGPPQPRVRDLRSRPEPVGKRAGRSEERLHRIEIG